MEIILTFLTPLTNTFLPYFFIALGIIVIILSLTERLAWLLDIAPRVLMRLLPVGFIMALFGFGLLALPGVETAFAAQATAVQEKQEAIAETQAPWIRISAPTDTVACTRVGPSCYFDVKGQAGGKAFQSYWVYIFVFPTNPLGPGYYLQPQPAGIDSTGSWTQFPSYFGSPKTNVESGNTFRLQAALVKPDAKYYGTPLTELPADFYLGSVNDIDGLVALSDSILVTVK